MSSSQPLSRRELVHAALAAGTAMAAWRTLGTPITRAEQSGVEQLLAAGRRALTDQPAAASVIVAASDSATARGTVPAPHILTRADWGADESWRRPGRVFAPVRKLLVHHTDSPNNPRDPRALIRMAYYDQVKTRGYDDIGYNFFIDHHGLIYEGRWARSYAKGEVHDGEDGTGRMVMGAHATNFNAGVCGVALIGTFDRVQPTRAALTSLINLFAWQASRHGIDATGKDPFVSLFGGRTVFPNIAGHGQVAQTDCPGAGVLNLLPTIRSSVRAIAGAFPAQTLDLSANLRTTGLANSKLTAGLLRTLHPAKKISH